MLEIIRRYATRQIQIKQRSGISDGKPVWMTCFCHGCTFDFTQDDISRFGLIQNGKIFLITPLRDPLTLPAKLIYMSREYEIRQVKTYRDSNGRIVGYRLAVAGA